jgi:NAD(P)-dependent dehydrogenase (short-subunit alcohol dehydrogenase family)
MRMDGKALVLTGGASGIGEAVARRFTAEGGRVAILDLDAAGAAAVAAELDGAIGIGADVADEASVEAAVAAAHAHLGRVDCVVNAAGHFQNGDFETFSYGDWNRMLAVHAGGTFLVCRAAVPLLRAAGGGSIVNYSSVSGLLGRPRCAAYGAAKGAISSLTRHLAADLAADGIRVNAIAPGRILTPLARPVYVEAGGGDFEKGVSIATADTPQRRIADPDEAAASTCFLLSDEASFITGVELAVDGGMSMV